MVGGDRINYPSKATPPTAELLVAKMLFNSVISTKGAQFMTMDISTFPVRGPQAFHIAYIHTQNNTTTYVGIKLELIENLPF
jgi:hypothetical protein